MSQKSILSVLFTAVILFSQGAFAEVDHIRVATIDVNKIMNELDEAQSQKKAFEAEREDAKKLIQEKQTELKGLQEAIQTKSLAPDSKEGIEFRAKMKEFERFVRDTEEDLKRDYMKANQKLGTMVVGAIESYAKKNNIDLVLEKTSMRGGPILFENGKADITAEVLATLK